MKNVYEMLLKVVDEDKMSHDGKYLTYYSDVSELAEQYGSKGEKLADRLEYNYGVRSVEGDFITLESAGEDGNLYTEADTAFNKIINHMLSENNYKKYVDREQVEKIRGY